MQKGMRRFALGDRVRVRRDRQFGPGPWPAEPFGRVVAHPEADEHDRLSKSVGTTSGPGSFYWIVFDEPQFDADGDGPYSLAEVLATYLDPA